MSSVMSTAVQWCWIFFGHWLGENHGACSFLGHERQEGGVQALRGHCPER
jgi:hypothetical protein